MVVCWAPPGERASRTANGTNDLNHYLLTRIRVSSNKRNGYSPVSVFTFQISSWWTEGSLDMQFTPRLPAERDLHNCVTNNNLFWPATICELKSKICQRSRYQLCHRKSMTLDFNFENTCTIRKQSNKSLHLLLFPHVGKCFNPFFFWSWMKTRYHSFVCMVTMTMQQVGC